MIVDSMLFPVFVNILNGLLRMIFVVVTVALINAWTLLIFLVCALFMSYYMYKALIVLEETNRLEAKLRTPTHDAFI